MKTNPYTLLLSLLIPTLTVFLFSTVGSFSNGPPSGATGSPMDNGLTCLQCHASNNYVVLNWIESTQLDNGYNPGGTYDMSAKAIKPGSDKFGFQLTMEDEFNSKSGYPVVTDAGRTQIVNTHYLGHTASGTSGTDSAVWNFKWIAPTTPVSKVHMYGAFMGSNNNSLNTGDKVFVCEKEVILYGTQGVAQNSDNGIRYYVYPNPANQEFNIDLPVSMGDAQLHMYDMKGRLLKRVSWDQSDEMKVHVGDLPEGSYILQINIENDRLVTRLLISR